MQMTKRKWLIALGGVGAIGLLMWLIFTTLQTNDSRSNETPQRGDDIELTYVHPVQWPPMLTSEDVTELTCAVGEDQARGYKTEFVEGGGMQFCRTISTEGAAGSVYYSYSYKFSSGSSTAVQNITFGVRMPQCENYDSPEKEQCIEEQKNFNPDAIVARAFRLMQ
jgi:hypothetical protein